MKKKLISMLMVCFGLAAGVTDRASAGENNAGIVAGWEEANGSVLRRELNCAACHAPAVAADSSLSRQAPILADVGARLTPQFLRAFLTDPQRVKAGTPMPDLLHHLAALQKEETVEALVHFLAKQGAVAPKQEFSTRAQIARGQDLYHSVGCVACHQSFAPAPAKKKAPDGIVSDEEEKPPAVKSTHADVPLGDLSTKTTLDALAKFLADPLHVRPSGRMPSLHLAPTEAHAIAAYLLRDQFTDSKKAAIPGLEALVYDGKWERVPEFDRLVPRHVATTDSISVNVVPKQSGKKPPADFGLAFRGFLEVPTAGPHFLGLESAGAAVFRLDGKVVIDHNGPHNQSWKETTLELAAGRHAIEIDYAQSGKSASLNLHWKPPGEKNRQNIPGKLLTHHRVAMVPKGAADFKADPTKADRGKALFTKLGCAACHETSRPGTPAVPLKAPELARLDPVAKGSCLDTTVAPGRPRYGLSATQRAALRQSLAQTGPVEPKIQIDQTMNALRCYACHVRDGKGGPDKARADYFNYQVLVDLGDEGRLPPPLTGVGAKLTGIGFEDALFSGKRYRSAMATRMPNFGKQNLGHFPDLLARADIRTAPAPTPAFSTQLIEDGRKLSGKNTLACINCHAWGDLRLPGAEGLDLLQVGRRLRPDWFHAWLFEPQKMRPGTRMPAAWPDGKSFFPNLQGGDTHKQIDAIWLYLAAAERSMPPGGLASTETALLVPAGEPIVFRTFLDKVSAHAILVGFPQRTHLAFDANRVRTAVAWAGDFVSTRSTWEGRGGEYAPIPSTNVAWLPEGPPFARLASRTDPWPKDLPKGRLGSNRTPPGWRFEGYRFGDNQVPTFLYSIGVAQVEETPGVELRGDGTYLQRRFRLRAPADVPELFLRVAAGKKIAEDGGVFTVDGLVRFRIDANGAQPIIRALESGQELLVPVRFAPNGNSDVSANLKVEMAW